MTFPIKKRINTELFIDRNKGLYIQKGGKETDQEKISWKGNGSRKYLTSQKRVNWNGGKSKCGNENTAACLEWPTLHGRKGKVMTACLKRQCAFHKKSKYYDTFDNLTWLNGAPTKQKTSLFDTIYQSLK